MLGGKQRRYLRGLGHHLEPVVQVGKEGITERLVGAVNRAIDDHELIKVRLAESVEGDRHEVAAALAAAAGAELVQVLGRTLLLYRRRAEEPRIELPEIIRFLGYGLLGWCAEIVWTAGYDAVTGTRRAAGDTVERLPATRAERLRLSGHTYLWMLPIYGLGGLLFEPAHRAIAGLPWPARGAIYTGGIFAVEYLTGWLLEKLTGRCPWDYSYARASVGGYIRLDYAPVWFAFGMLLERVEAVLGAVEAPLRAALS